MDKTQTVVCDLYKSRRGSSHMQQAVAYCRVSTERQRRSGLGIEAQRAAVVRFSEAESGAAFEDRAIDLGVRAPSRPTIHCHLTMAKRLFEIGIRGREKFKGYAQ